MAQLALSVVGAVAGGFVGSFFGNPVLGAEIGWMAGGLVGSLLVHPKGPNPQDVRIQDSGYGKSIPRVYGTYRVGGNIIWAGQPSIEDGGGKGGGGKGPQQTKVQMSFALGLCEGPITGVRRIWANGKLIYDISNPSNFAQVSGSSQMVTNFTVHLGDETQTADPTMSAALGAANTPAHRGLAYVVFNNLDLSTWGNYLPSFSFEVVAGAVVSYVDTGLQNAAQNPALAALVGPTFSNYPTHLDAAGNCYGWQWWISLTITNDIVIAPFTMTPYGITYPSPPINAGLAFPCDKFYSADDGGILMTDGSYYLPDGTKQYTTIATGLIGNYSGCKAHGRVFVSNVGGIGPVRIGTVSPTLAGASDITGGYSGDPLNILGATANYIYAATGTGGVHPNCLIQLDMSGNFVAVLDGPNSSAYDIGTVGYIVNDSLIYLLWVTRVYVWTGSGAATLTAIPGDNTGVANVFMALSPTGPAYTGNGNHTFSAEVQQILPSDIPLSAIVANECKIAGLSPSQYDVTQLTDIVAGYGITSRTATRNNIAPLMSLYFFDACDTDGQIKFVKRGAQPVAQIAYADLGASSAVGDEQNETPIDETIAQEVDLPRSLTLTYMGINTDYNQNTQRAFRGNTNSNKDMTAQAPVVLSDDEGLLRAQCMLWAAWVGRKTFAFATRLGYLKYEPGDVMTLQGATGQTYTVRLTRCQYDGQGCLIWQASLEEPDIYPSPTYNVQGGAPSGFKTQQIDYSGPTILAVLDVPPLRDSDTSEGLYLAACGYSSTWPGCVVDLSRDDSTFTDLTNITSASVIGITSTALPNFLGGNQPDELTSVTVVTYGGALAGCTYANFLAGVNAALIGSELVYFRNVTQTAANTYVLSGFLRGRVGTEWAMSQHIAGEQFVFLDSSRIKSMSINVSDIGAGLWFESHLLNVFLNQPATAQKVVPSVARVKPLSPAMFVAGHGSASATTDISLSWYRRARVNAQWLDGTDVPLDESAETYTLNIYSGATLKRTATISAAQSYVYTAANITADGFTTGNVITFTVQQNSDQGVLGYAATTTITR